MSTREEIAATLQGIFTKVLDADVTITNELSAADVPAWDSLNHIRLMVAVQKAFADAKNPNARVLLREFAEVLRGCDPFDAVTTDKALHDFATVKEVKPNAVVTPVRVAVTGSSVGFGLFDTLAILGKAVSLQRIESTLQ